jgi:serine/threonine protein kinase
VAGRYRLERILGEGASGRVYLARDTKERGAVWAVKELDYTALPIDETEEARQLFAREAELLKRLSHPSLPKVVDHFRIDDRDYLVMERVEGPTLEKILADRPEPLPEGKIWTIGLGLLETLDYLHRRNPPIIYRDLKPANVMVAMNGEVKLIDFGIARVVMPQKAGDTTAYGTPGYAPPEQYQGRTSPASDVYALGMTLLRAATLYDPPEFKFTHPAAIDLNSGLSLALGETLDRMISKDSEDRPGTAELIPFFDAACEMSPSGADMTVLLRKSWRRIKKFWNK